ncbi:Pyrophosphate--fructose 6-phosphate 1-phosphotransferase subunit alpha [Cocos nucifera]|uniref:Pyrophosphate--fructose 6-phosphate 1-phosphotransferase subunit alpha n=1 Tax=Cocos nucifera TaxID=13894 RepID=A0A8K0HUH0_COCNU|nr:Pyrophosphate--fructose 6-phosphate 1-phosphotransferase subunit alpha [Cocos nucifera]
MRVGVVFCGRQSPGGHNVVWGLYNAIKIHNPDSVLVGFVGGTEGFFSQKTLEITDDVLSTYKNQGGYDLLGRTKDQIRTTEQVNAAMTTCRALKLHGLVIIGGVTSNSDAAQLAETFAESKCPTKVVGVPVTLNGDLKNQFVETNVGFDTVCRGTTVRVEFGDSTTTADPSSAHVISRAFPHTFGQPLAHFLRATAKVPDAQIITEHPAMRVGVVFCGRQSPGGHNVVWGLYNAIKIHNPDSVLVGFVGGTEGFFSQKTLEITDDVLSTYKNQGGYDLLGRTKDQIRTTEQVNAAMTTCRALKLHGLVIIGGVTSNSDAAQLAETFAESKCPTKVVGVPVTLNGDLKNQFVETNVGFDTVCRVNSQLISNVCTDALSAQKVILGEEVALSKLTIFDITKQICDAVQARAEQEKYHGVILIPEGLVESIPELYALLQEIHSLHNQGVSAENISSHLSPWASALFEFLPPFIRKQLLLLPESDDSAQLSQIETEKLLAQLVETEMNKRTKEGTYKGKKFNAVCHFFGYQARGSLPSKFDCDYAYVLGYICYHILAAGLNGYMATVTNLKHPVHKWRCGAAPLTVMMTVKRYSRGPGSIPIGKPAIHPASVDLKGKVYELLRQKAPSFLMDDLYRNPGPLQFDGPGADAKTYTLSVEDQDYMGRIKKLQEYLDKSLFDMIACEIEELPNWVRSIVKPGCSQDVLKAALSSMASVTDVLSVMTTTSFHSQPPL